MKYFTVFTDFGIFFNFIGITNACSIANYYIIINNGIWTNCYMITNRNVFADNNSWMDFIRNDILLNDLQDLLKAWLRQLIFHLRTLRL